MRILKTRQKRPPPFNRQFSGNQFHQNIILKMPEPVFFVTKCILDLSLRKGCKYGKSLRKKENPMPTKSQVRMNTQSNLMRFGMMACCVVMLLPIAGFFVAGGSLAGLWTKAGLFAPLLLCVGAHLVMHKLMGRSCHAAKSEKELQAVPVLTDQRAENRQ